MKTNEPTPTQPLKPATDTPVDPKKGNIVKKPVTDFSATDKGKKEEKTTKGGEDAPRPTSTKSTTTVATTPPPQVKKNGSLWPIAVMVIAIVAGVLLFFKPSGEKTSSTSNNDKPDPTSVKGNIGEMNPEKDDSPPAPKPLTKVDHGGKGTLVLRATEGEQLKEIFLGFRTVGNYRFPLIKNSRGNPTPINGECAPFALAPVDADWQPAKYTLPTGMVVDAWAIKLK